MKISTILTTTVAAAAAASYYCLSSIYSRVNAVANACISRNMPSDGLSDHTRLYMWTTNPLLGLLDVFSRESSARTHCPSEIQTAQKYEFYSFVALGTLAVSSCVLAYKFINNTPRLWKTTTKTLNGANTRNALVETSHYLLGFIPTSSSLSYVNQEPPKPKTKGYSCSIL